MKLTKFNKAVDELTEFFVKKYFDKDADFYFISDEREGVLSVNDYFFNLEDIITSIRFNATEKQLFEWYDMALTASLENKELKTNYRNFLKYGIIEK